MLLITTIPPRLSMSLDEKLYAIVDVTNLPEALSYFENLKIKHSPLYPENLKKISPYIVELKKEDYDFKELLLNNSSPWGFLFTSKENFIGLRNHFRKYNYLKISSQEKPVFFRYFDPRILWELLEILDEEQTNGFLKSISSITTIFINKTKEFTVTSNNDSKLILTEKQYDFITQKIDEQRINSLFINIWEKVQTSFEEENSSDHEKHRKMLLESKNDITNPLDLAMIHEGDPILMRSKNSLHWLRISKDSIITLDNIISQKANEMNSTRINETDFLSSINDNYKKHYQNNILDKNNESYIKENNTYKSNINYHQLTKNFVREFYFTCKKKYILNEKGMIDIIITLINNNIFHLYEIDGYWVKLINEKLIIQ